MAEAKILPKFVKVGSGKRIVILDEEEYHCLLDIIDAAEAKKILADPLDKEIAWGAATKELIENKIADRRKKAGLTQRQLAQRMKIKPSTVSRWEKKDANLTLETLKRIARALGCKVYELIS